MRVLVTWGSKRGGTEGIARIIGEELQLDGFEVALVPAAAARPDDYDAVIVGGAVYANRWHAAARRFVTRHARTLRRIPTWFFSSGPLDDSADRATIPPPPQVGALMQRVGALGHATFGGRLAPDATGFAAAALAKQHAGDWRNSERICAWADELGRTLPSARPGVAVVEPGRAAARLALHGVIGWAACAAVMFGALAVAGTGTALVLHAIAAPILFIPIARHYFLTRMPYQPAPTAFAFVAIAAVLDLVFVAGLAHRDLGMIRSVGGTWLPLALIFLATWATGAVMSTLPWPRPSSPPVPSHP